MTATRPVGSQSPRQGRIEPRQRPPRPRRLASERKQLEAALEAALSVVEAAVALLDAMDGDTDLEPACEDEGFDTDREPDHDGASLTEERWAIGGREVGEVDGAGRSWAERLDPDDAPDPLQPQRLGYGCARSKG